METSPYEQARQAGEAVHHFHGGLRLRHNKRISCRHPLEPAPLPEQLAVPLQQHAGPAAVPTVTVGQAVRKGDPIARIDEPWPGCLHAPTSGRVSAIAEHTVTHPAVACGPCVVIEADGTDEWTALEPDRDWTRREPAELAARIAQAGIVGLGGAVFDTALKVDDAARRSVHTLILNGAECEPYISCDEMLMRERPDAVIAGAQVLLRATGAGRAVIAIEDQMGAVRGALRDALRRSGAAGIDIVQVTTIYPEGGERQLIQVLTGLEVPAGGRPTDLGLLCINVATAAAVAEAIIDGRPMIERIVNVTGNGIDTPINFVASLGTPIAALVAAAGGYTDGAARLVIGGPLMGYSLATDRSPVVKGTNCVLVLTADELRPRQGEMPCIRCGECARVCPAALLPQQLFQQVRNDLLDEAADYGLEACIDCGCCDYVCPSHIPLTEWFRFGKAELRMLHDERARADLARQRFEAREARLERSCQQRQQRIEEKKRALREDSDRKRRIADAVARARNGRDADRSGKRRPEDET